MEIAIVRFIGAGLTLVFEGLEEDVPLGAIVGGERFLAESARTHSAILIPAVERITSDIWAGWRLAKLPRPVAKAHLEALPALMDQFRVPQSQMTGAVVAAKKARLTGGGIPVHASRIASGIVAKCKSEGTFRSGELNDSVSYFFLDRLLTQLLNEHELFTILRPGFKDFLAARPWQSDAPSADSDAGDAATQTQPAQVSVRAPALPERAPEPATSHRTIEKPPRRGVDSPPESDSDRNAPLRPASGPKIEPERRTDPERRINEAQRSEVSRIAARTRIPEVALAAFVRADRDQSSAADPARPPRDLVTIAGGVQRLLARLAEPQDKDVRTLTEDARGFLAEGQIALADHSLTTAEDRMQRAAQGTMHGSAALLNQAAELRCLRAILAEIQLDYRGAAAHYAAAARCLPAAERNGRWKYLVSQALVLEQCGRMENDTHTLVEATLVHSEAARLISEAEAPEDWAETHLTLGNLLILLAQREERPERYLAAALHFKPAIDVFSTLQDRENWARAQSGLGQAMHGQGKVQGDIEILAEAALAFKDALGVLTQDRTPREWLTATYELGATLFRLGQESGDLKPLEEAAAHMATVLPMAGQDRDGIGRGAVLAKQGHILLALGAARGDLDMIAEAAGALQGAIEEDAMPLPEAATAAALDALGSALLVLAETENNDEATIRAAEAKEAALTYYQSVGEDGLVESLMRELEEIVSRLPEHAGAAHGANLPA